MASDRKAAAGVPLWRLLAAGGGTRIVVDTANQIFNPYLAIIASGLGVGVVTLGALVGLRSLVGVAGPALGAWADRVGYVAVTRVALILTGGGLVLFGLSRGVVLAALAMLPMGVGMAAFVPSLQAFLSERLPYRRRGAGLGVVELSWALAGILGLSAIGVLIGAVGWRTPFYVLGTILLATAVLTLAVPAALRSAGRHDRGGRRPDGWRAFLSLGPKARSAWGSIIVVALVFFAMMNVIVIFGAWLQHDFGLSAPGLGLVALYLGLCDLAGSLLVSLVADRVGKRRLLLAGALGCTAAYFLLPALRLALPLALLALGLIRFLMQVTYVSNVPLLSEQVPLQRGKVMALGFAAGQLGLAIASLTGPWAYTTLGVTPVAIVSGAAMVLALVVIQRSVRDVAGGAPAVKEIV